MTPNKLYGQKLRHELIKSKCKGKRTLDVGCAARSMGSWLHEEIARVTSHCVGIDVNAGIIEKMRKMGYDVRLANAEDFHLGERFEVVVLGEVIEHLSNSGMALDNVREHLELGGEMIVTTPNPFNPSVFIRYELQELWGSTHVAYHTPSMFKRLATRHGFKEDEIIWMEKDLSEPRTLKGKLFVMLGRFLIPKRFAAEGWLGVYSRDDQ